MMLAYQPVRSLATLNMGVQAGLSAARRILPVIDEKLKSKIMKLQRPYNYKWKNKF